MVVVQDEELGAASAGRNDEAAGLIQKNLTCLVGIRDCHVDVMGSFARCWRGGERVRGRFIDGWRVWLWLGRALVFSSLVHVAHGSGNGLRRIFSNQLGGEPWKASHVL